MTHYQQQVSKQQQAQIWEKALEDSAVKFAESSLKFPQEQIFATEILMKNEYLLNVAVKDPSSLKLAMFNVSAIGLSLNPSLGLAYLIPRKHKHDEPPRVVLDISYMGLIAIGVETGAILCAKSELVYASDSFIYKGPMVKPVHECDPFAGEKDRGLLRGGYCQAMLPSGEFLIEVMSITDMDKIRDKSEAFKKNVGPWMDWPEEMQKKCLVKRAAKWWPKSSPRLANALKVLNQDNGEGLAILANQSSVSRILPEPPKSEQISPTVSGMIKSLIDRAVKTSSFKACEEYMKDRIKDQYELDYALTELKKAKTDLEQQEFLKLRIQTKQ